MDNKLTPIEFAYLQNETLSKIEVEDTRITFTLKNGERFMLFHDQDCCENVYVEDIAGDISDLIGMPLLLVEESSNEDDPPAEGTQEFYQWTFYKMSTNRGSVTIRFFGSSNGYYSTAVSFVKLED